ncbi:hypothetical protein O4J56_06925 [Nocardiopsis sp. RSe5-2]|uniref:DNA polymerase III beta sliding clamp central domain-containing protein n=1 Tax=Nocardiopsis endophytica TaxID=3018445 RepID=A0ABT4U091_9ACTN|nr:hypothetical protein [Nocardiopsis endophytica]MDA2810368.1 hypothetical protein [Nocardiopsis endophytica]
MTTTITATTATITGERLMRLITAVAPFTGPADLRLDAVHIEADGHRVTAYATDRYTLGVARDRIDRVRFAPVSLDPDEVSQLRRTLMAHPGSDVDFTSATQFHEDPELALLTDQGLLSVSAGATGSVKPPLWRKALTECMPTGQGCPALAIRPEFLARLQPATQMAPEHTLAWFAPDAPKRPVVVTLGTWFHALLMPAEVPAPEAATVTATLHEPSDPPF